MAETRGSQCVDLRTSCELVTDANFLTQKAWGWVASLLYQAPWVTWKQAALRAHPGAHPQGRRGRAAPPQASQA